VLLTVRGDQQPAFILNQPDLGARLAQQAHPHVDPRRIKAIEQVDGNALSPAAVQ
jgi:uncharacterized protein YbjT (DUF2867 family)